MDIIFPERWNFTRESHCLFIRKLFRISNFSDQCSNGLLDFRRQNQFRGNLVSGKIIPIHLDGQGIPQVDQDFRTVGLLRYLNSHDFPDSPLEINQKGEIVMLNQKQN
jgi:hypothetical protein